MKNLRQIFSTTLLLCMCVIFTACPSPEPDTVEDFVDLSQTSLSYESTGGSTTLTVSSNVAWNVEGAPSWISVDPSSSGTGTTTIKVVAFQNSSTTSRSVSLQFKGGNASAYLQINQEAKGGGTPSTNITGYTNGHEWVDLGLPSKKKWATMNIGASSAEQYGDFYAWGEVATKSSYTWSNYKHCNGTEASVKNIGSNITSTDYDVALKKWGSKWQMPTQDDYKELCQKCTISYATINGKKLIKFTGPNGSYVYFPCSGYYEGSKKDHEDIGAWYWTATVDANDLSGAYLFGGIYEPSSSEKWLIMPQTRNKGCNVRAITSDNDAETGFDASIIKGTTWMMKNNGKLLTVTFDSNGSKGVYIEADGDEGDDMWDPMYGGSFTYSVSNNDITVVFDDIRYTVTVTAFSTNQMKINSSDNLWGNVTLDKTDNTLSTSNVVGTWKYRDDDNELWTINLASTGKGYLKYDGDKENIYWALSGKYILIMAEEEYEPEYVLTIFNRGSSFLELYYEEIGETVRFTK